MKQSLYRENKANIFLIRIEKHIDTIYTFIDINMTDLMPDEKLDITFTL